MKIFSEMVEDLGEQKAEANDKSDEYGTESVSTLFISHFY
jgi:hypothetical protein